MKKEFKTLKELHYEKRIRIKRNACILKGHPNKECFNSVEIKGKSCFICKNCGMYLGVIYPLDNLECSEETK